jgi:hypothetical protein
MRKAATSDLIEGKTHTLEAGDHALVHEFRSWQQGSRGVVGSNAGNTGLIRPCSALAA